MGDVIKLPIRLIRLKFQRGRRLTPQTVDEYITKMNNGETVPPVTVYFDGEKYWLCDGFHRVRAARTLRRREIEAEIVLGTYADLEAEWRRFLKALREDLKPR
jgi:hypothetical protein